MSAVQFKFDTSELNAALKKLGEVSDKLPSEIVNKKSFFIFRDAAEKMKAVEKETIQTELGASAAHVLRRLKNGKYSRAKNNVKMFFGQGSGNDADLPLAVAILQSRASKGKPSPWKGVDRITGAQRMTEALRKFYQARQKSRGYFKKGFQQLRGIFRKSANNLSGGGREGENGQLRISNAKPASKNTSKAIAEFWMESPKHDKKDAIDKYASPVLQAAMDKEASSTAQHADEEQFKEAIRALGIRVT